MDKKYKLWNKNKHDVGIRLMNGIEINIKPGSFYSADADNIYYLNTLCGIFKNFTLIIDDEGINADLGISQKDNNVISDREIEEFLNGNFSNMKLRFDKITQPHVKYRIFSIAKKNYEDLSGRQLNYLSGFCNREVEDFVSEGKKEEKVENKMVTGSVDANKEDTIKTLLKGNFMKMKSELSKYAEDKDLVYKLAQEAYADLSGGKIKFINGFCGKELIAE